MANAIVSGVIGGIVTIAIAAILGILLAFPVYFLWNFIGFLPPINFIEALAACALCKVLF
ncbi:MAG: hypothetical protein AAGA60_30095 [Cyanobacteria bacterium P01_E01_bin.42]